VEENTSVFFGQPVNPGIPYGWELIVAPARMNGRRFFCFVENLIS
jgi:hypothetical protein